MAYSDSSLGEGGKRLGGRLWGKFGVRNTVLEGWEVRFMVLLMMCANLFARK